MGSWDWDLATDLYLWDEGQYRIFGVDPENFVLTTLENIPHTNSFGRLAQSSNWA